MKKDTNKGKVDLHIHTTFSDGDFSPEEIVILGKEEGFRILAITDHDNINGLERAIKIGHKLGVKIIPGVELSTQWQGENDIHLLGYGINIKNRVFSQMLEKIKEERDRKAKKVVEKLRTLGFKICFSDLIKISHGSIGKPHIANQVLAIKENLVKLRKEDQCKDAFIKKYLNRGGLAYIGKEKIESTTAIDLIHQAGGLAVWAHPAFSQPNQRKLVLIVKEFKKAGLDGIEVFYRDHNKNDVELLLQLTRKLNFFITQGSDFHTPKRDKLGGFDFFGYSEELSILKQF